VLIMLIRKIIGALRRRIQRLRKRHEKLVAVQVPVLYSELLKGRKALITGGSCGIGLAIAEAFVRAGADVVITGRNSGQLDKAIARLKNVNAAACVSTLILDICDTESFPDKLKIVEPFDVLVNNAGYVGGGVFGTTTREAYDKTLETNLRGAYFMSQCVSGQWIANGVKGNILNVCSASSLRPGESAYILSKWGLRALTIGMARKLIKHGIVVNGIAPGCTDTAKFALDGNICNSRNPSGRMVTTVEIANMSVVLVSSLCRMVVGDVLYMTGGAAITTLDD